MGLFRRRRAPAPEWASFFSPDDYAAFIDAVRGELDRRGFRYAIENDVVNVSEPVEERLGLGNLAQVCHGQGPPFAAVVARHFDGLADRTDEDVPVDFALARDRLKARLIDRGLLEAAEVPLVSRQVADDLWVALAVDLPTRIAYVNRDHAAAWDAEEDELFDAGYAHARTEPRLELSVRQLEAGVDIWALVGDSFFTATSALWLEPPGEPEGPHGSLVAVPHRHAVLLHPIRDLSVLGAAAHIATLTAGMYREGPGSISPSLYWRHDGELTRLPAEAGPGGFTLAPPARFVEDVLNRLD